MVGFLFSLAKVLISSPGGNNRKARGKSKAEIGYKNSTLRVKSPLLNKWTRQILNTAHAIKRSLSSSSPPPRSRALPLACVLSFLYVVGRQSLILTDQRQKGACNQGKEAFRAKFMQSGATPPPRLLLEIVGVKGLYLLQGTKYPLCILA